MRKRITRIRYSRDSSSFRSFSFYRIDSQKTSVLETFDANFDHVIIIMQLPTELILNRFLIRGSLWSLRPVSR